MNYAREHGCDFMMLTSTGEPINNLTYICSVMNMNRKLLRRPFDAVDLQTSGAGLTGGVLLQLSAEGVTTIALSVAYLLDSEKNAEIMRTPKSLRYNIKDLCHAIKDCGFTLRLCLNLTPDYNPHFISDIFETASACGADQLTFKRLYANAAPQNDEEKVIRTWVIQNMLETGTLGDQIELYIRTNGRKMAILSGGETVYSYLGMSTVLIEDCQGQRLTDTPRYFILRPNGKLYTRWDDDGSIIF